MPSQTVDFLYAQSTALAGLFVSLVSNKDGVTKYSAVVASSASGQWTINPKPPAGTYTLYTGAAAGVLTTLVDPDFVVDPMQDDGSAVFPGAVTVNGGSLIIANANQAQLNGIATSFRAVVWQTAGVGRWAVAANATAEGGANAGSDFVVQRYSDAGAFIDVAFFITRSTGVATFADGLVVSAGGITVTAGGLTVTAGGITINAGPLTANGGIQFPTGVTLDTSSVSGQMQIGAVNAASVAIRGPQKSLLVGKALTALAAGAQTLTAAQLLGGEIEHTVTAAVADTTDTGANLDAAIANVANGDTFECHLTILGAFTVTLTAGVGVTIKGTTALLGTAAGKTAHLIFRRTAASTWTCYVVFST